MIYACEHCHFLFYRAEKTEQCPDCGKFSIRPANEDEKKEFESRLPEQNTDTKTL